MTKRTSKRGRRATTDPTRRSARAHGRRVGARSWVLVGVALLCVLGMVAPGLLFASGTNTATTTTPPSSTTSVDAAAAASSAVPCSEVRAGMTIPGDLTGCTDGSGTTEPVIRLGCPDGSGVVVLVDQVGRPGGIWKQIPTGATKDQVVTLGC